MSNIEYPYISNIPVSSSARNLGFIFDSDMSFTDQINSLSKSCHFHIRDIRRIRHLLPLSAATALANSLVSSKLDYCNSLFNGISQANLNKIQRIQNTLARVVTNTSKFEHNTPILKKLHWLPIKQRIDYKLCLLTYKTLQIQQPTYLYNRGRLQGGTGLRLSPAENRGEYFFSASDYSILIFLYQTDYLLKYLDLFGSELDPFLM